MGILPSSPYFFIFFCTMRSLVRVPLSFFLITMPIPSSLGVLPPLACQQAFISALRFSRKSTPSASISLSLWYSVWRSWSWGILIYSVMLSSSSPTRFLIRKRDASIYSCILAISFDFSATRAKFNFFSASISVPSSWSSFCNSKFQSLSFQNLRA